MKTTKKLVALLLSVILVLSLIPLSGFARDRAVNTLHFATMSDTHYYPQVLTPNRENFASDEEYELAQALWLQSCGMDAKEYEQSEDIIETALASLGKRAERGSYLLLSGDLSRNSEYAAHSELARMLSEFEDETGVNVVVINGNHDINTTAASSFVTGISQPAKTITAQEFYEVYGELGYDLATSFYAIEDGVVAHKPNALSYTVQLDDYTQLIVVDSGKYSFEESLPQQTGGAISDECLDWICEKADEATAKGMTNLLMLHHNMAPHMECEPSVTYAFCLDDYLRVAETFASHNIHYTFSGHLHQADIAKIVNDDGEVLYDCETGALTSFPNTYREMTLTQYEDGDEDMKYDLLAFDEGIETVNLAGTEYAQGEFSKVSFGLCYGGYLNEESDDSSQASAMGFVKGLILGAAGGILKEIGETGILDYIKEKLDFDLQSFLHDFFVPYIGDGLRIGETSILSVDNIMWFVEDLCGQVEELYLKHPENLWNQLAPYVVKLIDLKVSDYTVSEEVLENTGVGRDHTYGTFGDAVFSVVYYFYSGNEPQRGEDKLIEDFINNLSKGVTYLGIFDVLVDILFNGVVNDTILGKLELRVNKFFSSDYFSTKAGEYLNNFIKIFLRNDLSYLSLVNTVFELGFLPWSSIYDVVDKLFLQEYWTDSQDESLGKTLAWFIADFAYDEDPQLKGDFNRAGYLSDGVANAVYSTEKETPVATTDNFRLPTMISATPGDDSETQANINWFSKYTLEETDIEIYNAQNEDITQSVTMKKTSELKDRYFPGIDIGIIGFIEYHFNMYQHSVQLSGLTKGTLYKYRVGNKEKNWWSPMRSFETSSGRSEKNLTFFHMSDPQSQSKEQYTRSWANVVSAAFGMYPDAKFIACSGDLVDNGLNNKMWQWMFDTAANTGSMDLGNTFLLPATGNHDEFDDFATVSNFILPNLPAQELASGVYYSFDYNNAHIAVLNTNDLNDDNALSDTQIEWLKKDMTSTDAEWKFVMLHKALYSNGSHYDDKDVCALRDQLGTLLPALDIDLVLQGHDHVYLRTASLLGNKKTNDEITYLTLGDKTYKTVVEPTGTVYEISGCSGVKAYRTKDVKKTDEYFPRADKIVDSSRSMFSAIQIKDGILYFDAYMVNEDGTTENADSFAIAHDKSQGTVLPESEWPQEEKVNQTLSDIERVLGKILEVLKTVIKVVSNIVIMYGVPAVTGIMEKHGIL